jgi:hypothetical protein
VDNTGQRVHTGRATGLNRVWGVDHTCLTVHGDVSGACVVSVRWHHIRPLVELQTVLLTWHQFHLMVMGAFVAQISCHHRDMYVTALLSLSPLSLQQPSRDGSVQ